MSAGLSSVYGEHLSVEVQDILLERLRSHRIGQLGEVLARLRERYAGGSLDGEEREVQALFIRLLTCADDEPERFRKLVDHWALTFLLGRLVEGVREGRSLSPLLKSLSALLATRSLEGGLPPELVSSARLPGWGVPLLEDMESLGLEACHPQKDDPRYLDLVGSGPLALAESLAASRGLLHGLWPEILGWAGLLVPAFADMGGPPSLVVHRSASYGPGTPIFLTKVGDPFKHAEDIVHELQHERFFLLADRSSIGSWSDLRQRFISPYRSDPRPLRGLQVGLHAFLAVNELRLRALERLAAEDLLWLLIKTHRLNLFAFRTLHEHEELGPPALALFAQMACQLARQHGRIDALAPAGMRQRAEEQLRRHRASVASAPGIVNAADLYQDWDETAAIAASYQPSHGDHGT